MDGGSKIIGCPSTKHFLVIHCDFSSGNLILSSKLRKFSLFLDFL